MGSTNKHYIGDYSEGRENNFDFLRVAAAALVIFSHSYPISGDYGAKNPLLVFTHGKMAFGTLAVDVFFIMSGFLVTSSYLRSKSLASYWRARILRIYPGLIAAIIVTAFLIGPIATTLPLGRYFTDWHTYGYLLSVSLISSTLLPGVFENNILPGMNGSLWTLLPELWCYWAVCLLGLAHLLKKHIILLVCLAIIVASTLTPHTFDHVKGLAQTFLYFFRMFSMGALFYMFRDRIRLDWRYAALAFIGLIISNHLRILNVTFTLLGSYLVFFLAFCPAIKLHGFARRGDLSYGIYIYAFPIQQCVTHFFGGRMTPFVNFIISLPITVGFAYASWHLVEKRFLKLKNKRLFGIL